MPGNTFNIAVSGLNAAATRIAVSANNVANASSKGRLPTADDPSTTVYQPQRAYTTPVTGDGEGLGVRTEIQTLTPGYRAGFDPSSPYANERGEVAITNVDLATEIVEQKMAEVVYNANAKVIAIAARMEQTLIDELA